ncbi:OmpA family protein [Neiella sp. HB171785]|uniref:OmpA family protein n=1 Tax=Neiella litorisoli TaxID=2771431 RepID=A0A8J6QID1_9GAMM|nr:OmpA family protein [Neiella litorisoli]MBD1389112.1 OmpA family protein [Neiella litorisoli]
MSNPIIINHNALIEELEQAFAMLLQQIRMRATGRKLPEQLHFTFLLANFPVGSSELPEASLASIEHFCHRVMSDRALSIDSLIGHASQTGPEATNAQLASQRAQAVRHQLQLYGIYPPPVIVAEGSTIPIEQAPGQELGINRSVELNCWYDFSVYRFGSFDDPEPEKVRRLVDIWDRKPQNIPDQELETIFTDFREEDMSRFENSQHRLFIIASIVNLALERGIRRAPNQSLQQILEWGHQGIQLDLREASATHENNKSCALLRDAERIVEVAKYTVKSRFDGFGTAIVVAPTYDALKSHAWSYYDLTKEVDSWWVGDEAAEGSTFLLDYMATTDSLPSRPGGLLYVFLGAYYGERLNQNEAFMPFEILESDLQAARQAGLSVDG